MKLKKENFLPIWCTVWGLEGKLAMSHNPKMAAIKRQFLQNFMPNIHVVREILIESLP